MDSARPAMPGLSAALAPRLRQLRRSLATIGSAAAPLALEMAAVRLAQALDLFWMGRLSPYAIAAVGVGVGLRWLLAGPALGIAVGGMAAVARHAGEHDVRAASVSAWQAILLCLLLGAVPAVAGWALAPTLLQALGLGHNVFPQALIYLRISLLGLIPFTLLPTLGALMRAAGGVRAARGALLLSAGLTAAIEPLLAFGWGPLRALGVGGSALAAALGPAAGATVLFALLARGHGLLQLRRTPLHPRPREMAHIFSAGAPYSAQLSLRALARVTLLAILARFGSTALAAYAVADAILMLTLVPSYALAEAAAALSLRSLRETGKGAARGVWAAGAANLVYMSGVILALFSLGPQVAALFCPLPRVAALGADALRVVSLGYVGGSLGVIVARGLDVTGQVVPVAAVNMLTLWGVQVPVALLLSHIMGPAGVWMGLAVGGAANGLLMSYRFRRGRGMPHA